ncbi:methyltransferase [Spirillospora sp. CA-255316]
MSVPSSTTPAPAEQIYEMVTGSWLAAAVGAVAELGVADHMTATPRALEELADAVQADSAGLYLLLSACADLGLFQEEAGQAFALTPLGQALRSDSTESMRGFARWLGTHAERASLAGLATAVRTGRAVFQDVHGQDVWDYFNTHPEVAAVFNQGMTDISTQITSKVAEVYDFSRFDTLVDVGGGHGYVLASLLKAHPHLHGVLFDRPEVVAGAEPTLQKAGVRDRCDIIGGDFLTSVPAGGDGYLLSAVIHNWDDSDAALILANCRDAMVDHGRVLLAEVLVPQGPHKALPAKLLGLSMLANCGSRQRTETEFAALLDKADLHLREVHTSHHFTSVIEACKQPPAHGSEG